MLGLQERDLLLHLADAAGGFGDFRTLQVPLRQQLLNVLLFLLQGLLQGCRARDLPGIARRCFGELGRKNWQASGHHTPSSHQPPEHPSGPPPR